MTQQSPYIFRRLVSYSKSIAYWAMVALQPIIAIAAIIVLVFVFGQLQQRGFFVDAESGDDVAAVDDGTEYVCPMLCVPPSKEPGRCPVCGMTLKPQKSSGDAKDRLGLTIDPASRRLANIRTVVAVEATIDRSVNALGRISPNESSESTISAYIDGRLERLLVDFTGAQVNKGDKLAIIYSPDLYSSQIELLESKRTMETSTSTRERIIQSNRDLYESAKRRLLEFGLTGSQINELERSGVAQSRIEIVSPTSGTVTEKLAKEGQYVKTGMPILKVVDLSDVWLMLELFPEDAAKIRIGQTVSIKLQSDAGREFEGRIAFVDPQLNSQTQTIPVRVVVANDAGLIRVGEFAQATIEIRSEPVDSEHPVVVVPRDAVLIAGDHSVAYVETEPGRFEFREVKVGPPAGNNITVVSGIKPGESVVFGAAFMLDAAFNMAGKPSLIDPDRAIAKDETKTELTPAELAEIEKALAELSPEDQKLAKAQVYCPVQEFPLGSMGAPIKVDVNGTPVFICCDGCKSDLLEKPDFFLDKLREGIKPAAETPDESAATGNESDNNSSELFEMELPEMDPPD